MRMHLRALLLLASVATALAADESCVGRCSFGFDSQKKCQCDSLCGYYRSCCVDYESTCSHKITRGDTFHDTDYDTAVENTTTTQGPKATTQEPQTTTMGTQTPTAPGPTTPIDPDAEVCSAQPFDSFMQVKNGSIYAFRGEYFFELDEKSVLPGYPKLIKDVWGISGPIDAAFTRINCQGKTYIFKRSQYWRFEDGVLDPDYPREISVGFQKVPDSVDAAFAIPASNHRGKEKVFFFKGDRYYQYEFKHQPSHEECAQMAKDSPSVLFSHYTDRYCDEWSDMLDLLFKGVQGDHSGPRFIRKDWVGIRPPVDAAMAGRLYITPVAPPTTTASYVSGQKRRHNGGRGHRGRGRGQGRGQRQRVKPWELFDVFFDDDYETLEVAKVEEKQQASQPVQNIYFFHERVDLKTKRVDYANPPYPRSIGKYWLGCKDETIWAEK
ncbi:hypothetical protein COCON_G00072650 [Conger conger]|uniref:SMB domain-containing protein n=1 Tax=Conger conger TaxID=82655 RepID=A0A9Q1I1U0_CONCO|nr:hypothetical protein COCON_G00072650 [Conger conger]